MKLDLGVLIALIKTCRVLEVTIPLRIYFNDVAGGEIGHTRQSDILGSVRVIPLLNWLTICKMSSGIFR